MEEDLTLETETKSGLKTTIIYGAPHIPVIKQQLLSKGYN
jgi:hypothetical protein